MSANSDSAEKTLDPTPRKLEQARRKGDIAKSNDLSTTAAYFGFLIALSVLGTSALSKSGAFLQKFIAQPDLLSEAAFSGEPSAWIGWFLQRAFGPVLPWFAIPTVLVCLIIIAQRGFVFAPSKLVFKASRISPISNAKNKYGRNGLFEFAKSFTKLTLYSVVLGLFLSHHREAIAATLTVEPKLSLAALADLLLQFLWVIVLISAAIATIDYIWQRQDYIRRNRMSLKEMRDEQKEAEGDPEFKHRRKARAREIAMNQMLSDVPKADVVIVNPTHFAVALQWDRQTAAPVCVAKGVDEVAHRIRKIAQESGVPIQRDPSTARALFATIEIGQEIMPEHYRPVAAAIRFAQEMRRTARGRAKNGQT